MSHYKNSNILNTKAVIIYFKYIINRLLKMSESFSKDKEGFENINDNINFHGSPNIVIKQSLSISDEEQVVSVVKVGSTPHRNRTKIMSLRPQAPQNTRLLIKNNSNAQILSNQKATETPLRELNVAPTLNNTASFSLLGKSTSTQQYKRMPQDYQEAPVQVIQKILPEHKSVSLSLKDQNQSIIEEDDPDRLDSEYDDEDDIMESSAHQQNTVPEEIADEHEAEDIQQKEHTWFDQLLMRTEINKKILQIFHNHQNNNIPDDAQDANSNKRRFVQKYGVSCEIPSLYVQSSIIYHKDPQYSIQVLSYVLPNKNQYDVDTHFLDGSVKRSSFQELFAEKSVGFTLRFIKSDKNLKKVTKLSEVIVTDSTYTGNPVQFANLYLSKDCKYLMMHLIQKFELKIFEIKNDDIMQLQQDIRDNNTAFVISKFKGGNKKRGLRFMERVVFDQNNRFFALCGQHKVAIFNYDQLYKYKQKSKEFQPDFYEIDQTRYQRICDIFLQSSSADHYECMAASKIMSAKQIQIASLKDMNMINKTATTKGFATKINFFEKIAKNFKIKLYRQKGYLTFVMINGSENFIIQGLGGQDEDNRVKKNLNQIGDGVVHYISDYTHTEGTSNPDVESIFFIASKEYDMEMHVYETEDFNYDLAIDRAIQPNTLRILDFHYSSFMRLLSLNDGEFMLDSLDEEQKQNSYSYASVSAFNIKWPYVSFSGLENFILLLSVYSRQTLHRIEICPPDQPMKVCRTFITNTNDLFVVIRQETQFKLLTLNLDDINEFENMHLSNEDKAESFKFKQVFQYECTDVDYQPMLDLFVRGSSRKEAIQLNHKLQVFFLHDGKLMTWIEGKESLEEIKTNGFGITSKKLYILNDQSFLYCEQSEDQDDSESQISQVTVKFNDYDTKLIVTENSPKYDFQNFSIDRECEMLFLVLKYGARGKESQQSCRLKIYDLKEEDTCVLEIEIKNSALEGILKSNIYTLVNGHMYYNNNVFKIRYDLINDDTLRNLTNEEVFNSYENILELKNDQQIKMDTPVDSFQSHKFLYVVHNHYELQPKSLMILPYLHERRIYLNRIKVNTNYYYNTIYKSLDQDKEIISLTSKLETNDVIEVKKTPFIVCMNLSEHKFYTYSESGLLVNRFEYSDWVVKYGEPIAASDNGQILIFKKKRRATFTIIFMDELELTYIKNINISKQVEAYIEQLNPEQKEQIQKDLEWFNDKKNIEYDIQITNHFDLIVRVNHNKASDEGDSTRNTFEIKQSFRHSVDTFYLYISGQKIIQDWKSSIEKITSDFIDHKQKLEKRLDDFQKMIGKAQKPKKGATKMVNILYSHLYTSDKVSFKANRGDFIFFWCHHNIVYFPLDKTLDEENKKLVNLNISEKQKNSKIKFLDCSPEKNELAIVVENMQTSTVIQWDLKKNNEYRAFEVDKNHQIIWGHDGNLVLLTQEKTILANEYCSLKCFENDNFQNRKSMIQYERLGYDQGYKFDSQNHNWLVLNEYISLSFCYMTFVIKSHLEEAEIDAIGTCPLFGRAFDQVAYNYLINQNTCFITGDLVKKKYLELQFVLQNFERIDPILLEIITYKKQAVKKKDVGTMGIDIGNIFGDEVEEVQRLSCLHAAVIEGNNRAIDIIITFMAKIELNSSENFKDILHLLVDQQSFSQYLDSWIDQTQQMQEKNMLRVTEPYTEDFVAIAGSKTTYIDDVFFEDKMNEQKQPSPDQVMDPKSKNEDYSSYPVNLQQLRVDWLLNTDDGKNLLSAIHSAENLNFYEIPTLQMIIEYLYQNNKMVMMRIQLPLYLIQGALFFFAMFQTEAIKTFKREQIYDSSEDTHEHTAEEEEIYKEALHSMETLHMCVAIANQLISFLLIAIMGIIFKNMGLKFFSRIYTWIDIFFYSINTCISIIVLFLERNDTNQKIERILSCFAVFLFLNKSFYYLKLIDSVAPFVDIIIQIMIDIKYFMMVFLIAMAALATSFYLLGRNQLDFDLKDEIRSDSPTTRESFEILIPYSNIWSALWYMWQLCLGAAGSESYALGNKGTEKLLNLIYMVSQFFMIIHLLNMLIAIMGESFGNCKEVSHLSKIHDHLSFVLDNWYLNQLAIPEKNSLVFIVTAFLVKSEDKGDEILVEMQEQLDSMYQELTKEQSQIIKRQLDQESILHIIIKNQEKILENDAHKRATGQSLKKTIS